MLTLLGILLLTGGAILTFAVDRQVEGVDLQLVGWILMAGGGAALIGAIVRSAAPTARGRRGPSTRATNEERRAA